MSAGTRHKQASPSARGMWWDSSAGPSAIMTCHKPSCRKTGGGGDGCHCREMPRSTTAPALAARLPPSSTEHGNSSGPAAGKCEQVVVGVCAMNSKVCVYYVVQCDVCVLCIVSLCVCLYRYQCCSPPLQTLAPPMQSILSRLQHYDHIKIVVFSDHTILHDLVEDWPVCDCLLAFFSEGFPLKKAVDYVKLRKPFVFNDLDIQYTLQDRWIVCRHNVHSSS